MDASRPGSPEVLELVYGVSFVYQLGFLGPGGGVLGPVYHMESLRVGSPRSMGFSTVTLTLEGSSHTMEVPAGSVVTMGEPISRLVSLAAGCSVVGR